MINDRGKTLQKKKKENHNQGLLSSSPKEISYNGFIYKAT